MAPSSKDRDAGFTKISAGCHGQQPIRFNQLRLGRCRHEVFSLQPLNTLRNIHVYLNMYLNIFICIFINIYILYMLHVCIFLPQKRGASAAWWDMQTMRPELQHSELAPIIRTQTPPSKGRTAVRHDRGWLARSLYTVKIRTAVSGHSKCNSSAKCALEALLVRSAVPHTLLRRCLKRNLWA